MSKINDVKNVKEQYSTTKNLDWGQLYQRTFTAEEIYCEGCKSDNVFMLCKKCDITECNKNQNTNECAECDQYQCDRIKRFYEFQDKNKTELYE